MEILLFLKFCSGPKLAEFEHHSVHMKIFLNLNFDEDSFLKPYLKPILLAVNLY